MAVSAAVLGGVMVYTAYEQHQDAKDARRQAEEQAAKQREALVALRAEPTPVIPIADELAKDARRKSIVAQMRRRGRASTILTDTGAAPASDALGG